jgi:hypothetical protein
MVVRRRCPQYESAQFSGSWMARFRDSVRNLFKPVREERLDEIREIGLRDRSVRPRVMLSEFAVYTAGAFRDKTKGRCRKSGG